MTTTAWKAGATLSQFADGGSQAWIRLENNASSGTIGAADVAADDNVEIWGGGTANVVSHCVRLRNFGFTTSDIPSGATINKVSVRVKKRRTASNTLTDTIAQLAIHSAGSSADRISTNQASAAAWTVSTTAGGGSFTTYEFTTSLPTDAQIRASTFAFDFRATAGTSSVAKIVGVIEVQVDYSPPLVSTDVGRADETDTAFALAAKQATAYGLAAETDSAIALAKVAIAPASRADEADTAFALARRIVIPVGMASETDSAVTLSPRAILATALAAESDAALALTRKALTAPGRADETDTAFALSVFIGNYVGMAAEFDEAVALRGAAPFPVGMAAETDMALALAFAAVRATGRADEADMAVGMVARAFIALGIASETDTALGLSAASVFAMGMAEEFDRAFTPGRQAVTPPERSLTFAASRTDQRRLSFLPSRADGRTLSFNTSRAANRRLTFKD